MHFNVPYGNVFYLQFTLLDVRIYYKLYTNASFLLFSNFNYYHSHLLLEYSNSCLSYIRKEVSNLIGMEILLSYQVFTALAEDQTSLSSIHTWKLRTTCSPISTVYLTTSVISVHILMHMTRRKMCTCRYIAQVCKEKFQFEKKLRIFIGLALDVGFI